MHVIKIKMRKMPIPLLPPMLMVSRFAFSRDDSIPQPRAKMSLNVDISLLIFIFIFFKRYQQLLCNDNLMNDTL